MKHNVSKIEKFNIKEIDEASETKIFVVNRIIDGWNMEGWKLPEDHQFVRMILDASYMGCVDCGLSDCIYPENGVEYEEALVELRDAVEYEIEKCLGNGVKADETRKYFVQQGWLPA